MKPKSEFILREIWDRLVCRSLVAKEEGGEPICIKQLELADWIRAFNFGNDQEIYTALGFEDVFKRHVVASSVDRLIG